MDPFRRWAVAVPLGCFLALGPALPAAPETASGGAITVWLRLPERPSREFIETTIPNSEDVLKRVLAGFSERSVLEGEGRVRTVLAYGARGWNLELGVQERSDLLELLKAVWGDDLTVCVGPCEPEAGPGQKTPPERKVIPNPVDTKAVRKALDRTAPPVLGTENGGRVFDGGKTKGSGGAVAAGQAKKLPEVPFGKIIREEAASAGVSEELVIAVVGAKSDFRPGLKAGGAYGLMLVSPGAARRVGMKGADLTDPRLNVRAGSRLLASLLEKFEGNVPQALAAYQAGSRAARRRGVFKRKDVKFFVNQVYREYYRRNQVPLGRESLKSAEPQKTPGTVEKTEPPSPVKSPPRADTPFEDIVQKEAAAVGIEPDIVRAVVAAKSKFNPDHKGGGAYGLMMVSRGAAKAVGMSGVDLMDPQTNIRAGSRLLARLLKQFDGDLHRALAAYQAGPGPVIESGGIPNRKDVKYFLANFEKAYRKHSPVKPPVEAVEPPESPNLRRLKDEVKGKIYPEPKDPVSRYRPLIDKYAAKHGVDADLIECIMRMENPWGDPKRVSDKGAIGLMQIMPSTAADLKIDPFDPEQNIEGGIRHYKYVLGYLGGDPVLAVAGYNSGHGRVKRLKRVPNIRETVRYVVKVFEKYYEITGTRVDCRPHMSDWARRRARRYSKYYT